MSFAHQDVAKLPKGGIRDGPKSYFSQAYLSLLKFLRGKVPESELKSGLEKNYFNNDERAATVTYRDPRTGLPTLTIKPEWWRKNICRAIVAFDAVLGVVDEPSPLGGDSYEIPISDPSGTFRF